ncbi:hypothetical protein ACA910_008247 [Epithemia clementina (nom. ined.)]
MTTTTIMKLTAWLACSLASVQAFGVLPTTTTTTMTRVPTTTTTTTTTLYSSVSNPTDTKSAMEAAMAASKEFGPTSPEARAAWEVVEDLRFGADISEATKAGLDVECAVDDIDGACQEYDAKMTEFKKLLGTYKDQFSQLQLLTSDLSKLKLGVTAAVQKQVDSPEQTAALKEALATAKQTTADYGLDSNEARLAWEAVEELASANMAAAMQPSLDKECLVEQANDACRALEELAKALEAYQEEQEE